MKPATKSKLTAKTKKTPVAAATPAPAVPKSKKSAAPAPAAVSATSTATVNPVPPQPKGAANGQITTASIATRAYILWEQAGRPAGRDVEYWLLAEAQLKQVAP